MQLGIIGLGRMGASIARRLMRAGHQCVVFDVRPGAVVVDVGINRIEDPRQARDLLDEGRLAEFEKKGHALCGDVHAPSVREVASALTPVPGGVGPLTIALLMQNTVKAAAARA
jgi:methylenetetrahydrofolate dehydrogenase (NADP+)/methenyltetrahydrofolate cyclohydrolase